jgi:hypothetical protein
MRKIFLLTFLVWISFFLVAWAEDLPSGQGILKESQMTYHVHFFTKHILGISREAKGKGICQSGQCEFLVAVPVKSFDSKDTNRDLNMLNTTKAQAHPLASAHITVAQNYTGGILKTNMQIEFAGQKKSYPVELQVVEKALKTFKIKGTIPVVLSDFNVDRPSLLGMKIDDLCPVDLEASWQF